MIYKREEYAKGNKSLPDRRDKSISVDDKNGEEYCRKMLKSIYSLYCNANTASGAMSPNAIDLYRSYAYGNQSSAIYEDFFFGNERKTGEFTLEDIKNDEGSISKRKASSNINFDIQSPAPKTIDALISKIKKSINNVTVDGIDTYSQNKKEDAKWGAWVDKKYQKELDTLKALAAIPQEEGGGFTPQNKEELYLYEAEGGFRPSYVTVMEQLLKYVFEVGRWDEYILRETIFDLIVNGFSATLNKYDKETGTVRPVHLDAKGVGVQYCPSDGYSKPDFAFFTRLVPLSELRSKGYSDESSIKMASKFSGLFGNDKFEDNNSINKENLSTIASSVDSFLVPTFTAYWKDFDNEEYIEHTNRFGKKTTRKYKKGAKIGKKDKVKNSSIKMLRQASWVIDTEYIYDNGLVEDQMRDSNLEPVMPINMVQVKGRPLISRMIPALDLYMNSWIKLQNAVRMSAIGGFAIDVSILNNLSLGGKKLDPKLALQAYRETGTLFFSSKGIGGRDNAMMRPIEQLPSGAGAVMQDAINGLDIAIRQIESLTGINPITLGDSPNARAGKAVTEFSVMGTANVLDSIVTEVNVLKSDTARDTCRLLQYAVKHNKKAKNHYSKIVGETQIKLLEIANGHDVEYGIRTHTRPTDQDIAELKSAIELALKNGRDGKVGITEADYVRFNSMINSGESLKRIAMLLSVATRKAQRERNKHEEQMVMLNQKSQMEAANKNAEREEYTHRIKTMSDIEKEKAKGIISMTIEAIKKGEISYKEGMSVIAGGAQAPAQQTSQQPEVSIEEENTSVDIEGENI